MKQAADRENEAEHIERQADIVVAKYKARLQKAIKQTEEPHNYGSPRTIFTRFVAEETRERTCNVSELDYIKHLADADTIEEANKKMEETNKKIELDRKIEARAKEKLKHITDEVQKVLDHYGGYDPSVNVSRKSSRSNCDYGVDDSTLPDQTECIRPASWPAYSGTEGGTAYREKPPSRGPTKCQRPLDVVFLELLSDAAITGACIGSLIFCGVILYNILT